MTESESSLAAILSRLEQHLIDAEFKGFDPFDALNSPFIRAMTFGNRLLGVAAVQAFKRSPINLRRLFGVRAGINPKGWGLLLAGYVAKYRVTRNPADLERAGFFADWLIRNPSPGWSGACWGYNFDWPNRNAFFPAGTPTIVNTFYIADALLDYADAAKNDAAKATAISAGAFVLNDLNRSGDEQEYCLSYTPRDHTLIHNANMLGAALLARLFAITGDPALKSVAQAAMRYSLRRQQDDGAWRYGEEPRNAWIDSYHTGYSLLALKAYHAVFPHAENEKALKRGFAFYLDHFFTPAGFVKYFHDRTYPWDTHAAAHAVLTLDELEALAPDRVPPLRDRVLTRIAEDLWDEKRGSFVYQIHRHHVNRIDYIRWVQCWMWYGLWRGNVEGVKDGKGVEIVEDR